MPIQNNCNKTKCLYLTGLLNARRRVPSLLKHVARFFLIALMTLLINCGSSFNNCALLNILSIKSCAFAGGVEHALLFEYPHRKK